MTNGELQAAARKQAALDDIVEQLKIANALKALELKLKFHAYVQPTPEWAEPLDELIEPVKNLVN